ncbi:MAG: hypothetical protein M3Q20_03955 [Actinomycetota bacterium]|nr:hypothetical protein [Actinomycetota bacterium]
MTIEEHLLARGRLQAIPVDAARVARLLDDSQRHLATAAVDSGDLAGAYQLGYDSARKEKYVAVDGVQAVAKLDRLRRTRNEAEYRGYWFDRDDVISDLQVVSQVLSFVETAAPTA